MRGIGSLRQVWSVFWMRCKALAEALVARILQMRRPTARDPLSSAMLWWQPCDPAAPCAATPCGAEWIHAPQRMVAWEQDCEMIFLPPADGTITGVGDPVQSFMAQTLEAELAPVCPGTLEIESGLVTPDSVALSSPEPSLLVDGGGTLDLPGRCAPVTLVDGAPMVCDEKTTAPDADAACQPEHEQDDGQRGKS